jgi:hypothetical protein
VGGGHQAEAHLAGLGFAQAVQGALLQHPQQLGLHVQRQLAQFIQEERAAFGRLDLADHAALAAPVKAPSA